MVYLTNLGIPTSAVIKQSRMASQKVSEINAVAHHAGCMNRHKRSDKPDWVPPRSVKLLDQVRERARYLHHTLHSEKAYVYWATAFVLWVACSHNGFRQPRELGQTEIEGFLTMLANEK